jgi:phosphatidylserine decarboxylase
VIRWFVGRYGVNMAEAANPDIASYPSFNEFFTRPLKPGARPLADADYICPVDGAISQFGRIERDQIFQAKGHSYSTHALVGGDRDLAIQFQDGEFATLYLSPRDYHRIHMPCDGRLTRMIYIPGDLFSVNPPPPAACPACSPATSGWCASSRTTTAPSCSPWWAPPSSAAWPPCGTARSTRRGRAPSRNGTTPPARSCSKGRRDGPLPARLHGGDALPQKRLRFTPDWAPAPPSAWARRWAAAA